MIDSIYPQDLAAVQIARLQAENALKMAEVAQLKVFIKYGLTEADSFDVGTGKITRAPKEDEVLP